MTTLRFFGAVACSILIAALGFAQSSPPQGVTLEPYEIEYFQVMLTRVSNLEDRSEDLERRHQVLVRQFGLNRQDEAVLRAAEQRFLAGLMGLKQAMDAIKAGKPRFSDADSAPIAQLVLRKRALVEYTIAELVQRLSQRAARDVRNSAQLGRRRGGK